MNLKPRGGRNKQCFKIFLAKDENFKRKFNKLKCFSSECDLKKQKNNQGEIILYSSFKKTTKIRGNISNQNLPCKKKKEKKVTKYALFGYNEKY